MILGQVIPAGTGSIGVHSETSTQGGVEKLASGARIDLDMDPGVVAHQAMESVDRDRVDPHTGLTRSWTRRLKRDNA